MTVQSGTLLVLIKRDITCEIPKTIRPWELPIIQAKYPGQVTVGDFTQRDVDELPDEEEEYARLAGLYGNDEDTKLPFVALAYGSGDAGIDALELAINASHEPPKPRTERKQRRKEAEAADSAPKPKPDQKPAGK